MLKFLLILAIFIYVVYKASNFITKIFFPLAHAKRMQEEYARKNSFGPKHRREQQQRQARRSPDGSINVDYIPSEEKKERSTQDFKGGEYVDYEEIK